MRGEGERWEPTVLDAAAGLTVGAVDVVDTQRLLTGGGDADARQELPGAPQAGARARGGVGRAGSAPPRVALDSGRSTLDQSVHAPAGVAGAVGGFMLASAVVCAILALALGPAWLLGTVFLGTGGVTAIHLAGDWLGRI